METKQILQDLSQEHPSVTGLRCRRLLPYLSLLVLGSLILGLGFALGGFSFPATVLSLASAGESQPEASQTPAPPAKERLFMLSSGDIPLLQSLQEREALLKAREQQLAKREEGLNSLQQQLEEKLTFLTVLRKDLGTLIEEKEAFEEQRFEHLVKVYEGMKPAEAAPLVERLNHDTAVRLLYRMKEKKVSHILGFIKPAIAAKLSEHLAVRQEESAQQNAEKEQR
jgi:flagellar motility protein MotE (MotC chaperone)